MWNPGMVTIHALYLNDGMKKDSYREHLDVPGKSLAVSLDTGSFTLPGDGFKPTDMVFCYSLFLMKLSYNCVK